MVMAETSSRERSCGSADCGETESRAGAGAQRAAVITAGLCEKTQSAQWDRAAPEGASSSCRWTDCTNPSPASKTTASSTVNRRESGGANWPNSFIAST